MAASLLLLLDDIASVLDDVSIMTKVAAKKTAGVLGDDLALNAKQVAGVRPARELPVVWAVARGSAINKLILVPAALAISWLAPWAVTPLLMVGGGYLCYEGMEKILHGLMHRGDHDAGVGHAAGEAASAAASGNVAGEGRPADETRKIAGAIRTDFILSAEIVVIALGVVAGRSLPMQLAVLAAISVAMTAGVYGLVAGIVKVDDLGFFLAGQPSGMVRAVGRGIVAAAPWLLRSLSVAGTAAMFLVGGGIIAHGVPQVHRLLHARVMAWLGSPHGGSTGMTLLTMAADAAVGMIVGLVLVAALSLGSRMVRHVRSLRAHR